MALTRVGATEELTGLAPRSQMGPATATPTQRAPTLPAPLHARATRASPAMGQPAASAGSGTTRAGRVQATVFLAPRGPTRPWRAQVAAPLLLLLLLLYSRYRS